MNNKSYNIAVIGIGRLGLAWSLVLEKAGHSIIGCDIIDDYVKSLNDKTFKTIEPKVNDYLDRAKNFKATTDLKLAISSSDIVSDSAKYSSAVLNPSVCAAVSKFCFPSLPLE